MDTLQFVMNIVRGTMFASVALMAFIYSLPIVCIRRFQLSKQHIHIERLPRDSIEFSLATGNCNFTSARVLA